MEVNKKDSLYGNIKVFTLGVYNSKAIGIYFTFGIILISTVLEILVL